MLRAIQRAPGERTLVVLGMDRRRGEILRRGVEARIASFTPAPDGEDDPPSWDQVVNPIGRDKRDEPLHVRSFAGKIFDPNDEEHTAMVRVAIAAGRDEDKTTSSELVTYVFGATGFRRTTKGGSRVGRGLSRYVNGQLIDISNACFVFLFKGLQHPP